MCRKNQQEKFNNQILEQLTAINNHLETIEKKVNKPTKPTSIVPFQYDVDDYCRETLTKNIISQFDFEKVACVMHFLNWSWIGHDVLTAEIIQEQAEGLVEKAWNDLDKQSFDVYGWREWRIATGGLEVYVAEHENFDSDRICRLSFVAEQMSND